MAYELPARELITLAALVAGAAIALIGAGAWAAIAAFGFIVFLVALAAALAP
jgi:hypothetical protein